MITRPPATNRPALASWRALLRNFATLATGEAVARVFGLIAVVVMARELQPSGFGLVTLATTLALWFRLIMNSGTEVINLRDISREPQRFREFAEAVLGLRLAMSLVAVALYGVAVWLVADSSDRDVLWLFALVLPAAAINLRWMVLGIDRSRAVAVGNVGSQALFMTGVLLLVNDRHDTLHVPLLQSAGELLYALAVLGAVAREFGVLRPRIDLSAWRRNLREGAPLVVTQFSRALIQSFDVFLVAVVLGTHEAGFYGAAYKPILFFTMTSGLLFNSFLASYSAADSAGAAELFRRTVRLAVFATVPIALALSFGSQLAVTVAFGAAYAPAHVALSILAWAIVLVAIGGAYAIVLIATNRQSLLMRHTIAGAVFNIVVNLAVVPIAGIEGAATVTLASMLLVIALNYRSCARLGLAPSFGSLVRRTPAPLRADP